MKEEFSDCDFIWTAWKKQKHIDWLMANQHAFKQSGEEGPVQPSRVYNKLEQNK